LSAIEAITEQHVCTKFCVKLGKSANETLEIIRDAFGEHSLSRIASFECKLKLPNVQGGQAPAKRQKHAEKIGELIHEDRRRIIYEVADTGGISYGVCQEILTEISTCVTLPRSLFPDS
jgi:hypothetical protein